MEQYEFIKELGQGSNGRVCLYKDLSTNNLVAIKHIKQKQDSIHNRRELFSLEKLRNCSHVVKIIKSFCLKTEFCIVLEYCEGGSLEDSLQNLQNRKNHSKYQVICDLIRAVHSVHKASLVHRDIKPENILFKGGVLKLSDFGLSKIANPDEPSTSCGTPLFMAPEMFIEKYHDQTVDIWALGCVVFQILKGRHPFMAKSRKELNEVQKKQIDFTGFSEAEVEFFSLVFQYDSKKRASIEDVTNSRLVQSYLQKISNKLNKIYEFYEPFNNQDARIIRSAISLYFCTDPLFQIDIRRYLDELKSLAKYYKITSFDQKLVGIFLKTIAHESRKLNQSNPVLSNYLLYLHRRTLMIPNPHDYDILLTQASLAS